MWARAPNGNVRKKEGPAPQGSRECRAVRQTGRRAGRPGPGEVCQLHPVVSPQFSHLWQVPLRTVSQPQRGQGGASGVELSRLNVAGAARSPDPAGAFPFVGAGSGAAGGETRVPGAEWGVGLGTTRRLVRCWAGPGRSG